MASIRKLTSETTGAISYKVMYRTPEGAQRAKTFRLQRDAKAFAATVETVKASGDFVDPQRSSITMGDYAVKWLEGKTNLAESTRSRYLGIIDAHIKPRWGGVPLAKVQHEDIQEWLAKIDRAPATVRKIHRVLSEVLGYAVRTGRLSKNPADNCSLPRVSEKEMMFLTHAQVEALAEACGPEWSLLVRFLAYTGLRWGELAALKVSKLDLLHRRAIIAQSVTPVDGRMVFGDCKGHSRRDIPVPKFLVADLYEQIEGKSTDDFVFTGPLGAILRVSTFRSGPLAVAKAKLVKAQQEAKDAGQPFDPVAWSDIRVHDLRHTAASLAIAAGADVKVVQQMLGHKSATMTLDRYGHLFPDRLDQVADAMDQARTVALAACF